MRIATTSTIMQGESSHSIKLDNTIFEIYFPLTTDTSDNIWNENIKKWKYIGAFLISNWSSREGIHWIRLVNSWTYKSDLETIAFKALMIMPGLLLQKTFLNSKSKENSETLKRRLLLWKNGQLDQFIFERKTIKARQATK